MKLLVIEDESLVRKYLAAEMRERGMEVDEAVSVRDALAKLHAGKYNMVLLDWYLEDATGKSLIEEAKRMGLGDALGKVVVLTAHRIDDIDFPTEVKAAIRKPAQSEDVAHVLEEVAAR